MLKCMQGMKKRVMSSEKTSKKQVEARPCEPHRADTTDWARTKRNCKPQGVAGDVV